MVRFEFVAAYIMANRKYGTLYSGSTSDLLRRVEEHKSGRGSHFTAKYICNRLVWFEPFQMMGDAIQKERRLKEWKRQWKIDLIEARNPDWKDLSSEPPFHRL